VIKIYVYWSSYKIPYIYVTFEWKFNFLNRFSKNFQISNFISRSQWQRGLRRRSAATRLLRSWVRIPPGSWMFVCCKCCVLSGRGLCDELITRPEESYQLRCVVVCDLETSIMRRPWPSLSRSATKKSNFMKILPLGASFSIRTERMTDLMLIIAFRNFANAPKNGGRDEFCPLTQYAWLFSLRLLAQCNSSSRWS